MKLVTLFTLLISLTLLCSCERLGSSMKSAERPVAATEEYKTTTQVSLQQADLVRGVTPRICCLVAVDCGIGRTIPGRECNRLPLLAYRDCEGKIRGA